MLTTYKIIGKDRSVDYNVLYDSSSYPKLADLKEAAERTAYFNYEVWEVSKKETRLCVITRTYLLNF